MDTKLGQLSYGVWGFVGVGVALAVWLFYLMGKANHMFDDKHYFYTLLPDAAGLTSHPAIFYKGVEIGRVDEFELDLQLDKVKARCVIYEDFMPYLVEGSVLVRNRNLLLNQVLDFELLLPANRRALAVLGNGSELPLIDSELGKRYAQKGNIAAGGNKLDDVVNNLNQLLTKLQKTGTPEDGSLFALLENAAHLSRALVHLGDKLNESNILAQAQQNLAASERAMSQVPRTLAQLESLSAQLHKLVSVYQKPRDIIAGATDNKLPDVMQALESNLLLSASLIGQLEGEKQQVQLLLYNTNQMLMQLGQTLQALNNHPLLKDGIGQHGLQMETYEP